MSIAVTRRVAGLAVLLLVFGLAGCRSGGEPAVFVQEPLPYGADALEPVISAETLNLHYGKHHAAYVAAANRLLAASPIEGASPEEVLRRAAGKAGAADLFNQAAQAWNHSFFWKCLKPGGGGEPTGRMAAAIDDAFGSYREFRERFAAAAAGLFGSGWVWLVSDGEGLEIVATANADTPVAHGLIPLLTVDVWEHAYYLDYNNRRSDYVASVMDRLVNWEFAASRLEPEPAEGGADPGPASGGTGGTR